MTIEQLLARQDGSPRSASHEGLACGTVDVPMNVRSSCQASLLLAESWAPAVATVTSRRITIKPGRGARATKGGCPK